MTDKQIIRELAKKYMEHALSDKQQAANRRMQDTNDLKMVRPPVLINEIPWHQMDIDGALIILLDRETLTERVLPELAQKHFP